MAQKMKLRIIGTGAIIVPEASASALIDDRILVDCGAGTLKQLLRLGCDLQKIDTILITHLHLDHFADVPFMMLVAKRIGKKLNIFLPEGGIKATHEIAKYVWDPEDDSESWWPQNVELTEYAPGKDFIGGDAVATPIKVKHGNLKANGLIIRKDSQKIGFSGDSALCDGIIQIMEAANYIVLDASHPKTGNNIHMGLDDIYELCRKYPDKKVIVTHMFEGTRGVTRRDIPNLIVPNDGEVFEL